jgi:ribulose-5-phosphate 4-epimerase/fuculose-1-phosphate aldolase
MEFVIVRSQIRRNYRMNRRNFLTSSVVFCAGTLLPPMPLSAQGPPASAGPADPALIEDLVAANRILAQQGVLDGYGHVSVRHNLDPNRFLLSRSLAPELVTPADILEFDLDSNPVDAKGRPVYSERFIHGEIYKARRNVQAVVHSHTPSLVAFAISSIPLRPVYHMASFIGDGLPIFEIRKVAGMTDMLVSDSGRGRSLAEALAEKAAVLMRGHGVAVVGSNIPMAVGRSIYLDLNARIQTQAISAGGNVTYLDPEEGRKVMEAGENGGYARPWELWRKKALGR